MAMVLLILNVSRRAFKLATNCKIWRNQCVFSRILKNCSNHIREPDLSCEDKIIIFPQILHKIHERIRQNVTPRREIAAKEKSQTKRKRMVEY